MSSVPDDLERHRSNEATPLDLPAPTEHRVPEFGLHDRNWSPEEWHRLLTDLITSGVGTWKDVTALVLGHLNPSQVGTSLASSAGFKKRYGKGKTMRIVMDWVYNQTGRCADCGSRLELQADHIQGRESFADPLDADYIENITLRCRRCNVVKRPSHEFGGLTFLTAEASLMWILLVIRPRTRRDYIRLCRLYGMTMSDIRMDEAWAMAHWLAKGDPPAYGIEDDEHTSYDLVLWPDSAITRVDVGLQLPDTAKRLYTNVSGSAYLGFLTLHGYDRMKFHEQAIAFIPFSTYNLGQRPPQSLCIRYSPPDRKKGEPQRLAALPPRSSVLLYHAVRGGDQQFMLESGNISAGFQEILTSAPPHGKLVRTKLDPHEYQLKAI